MTIRSKPASKEYKDNFDSIFRKDKHATGSIPTDVSAPDGQGEGPVTLHEVEGPGIGGQLQDHPGREGPEQGSLPSGDETGRSRYVGDEGDNLSTKLRIRADIRRKATCRGAEDRLANDLDAAADRIDALEAKVFRLMVDLGEIEPMGGEYE